MERTSISQVFFEACIGSVSSRPIECTSCFGQTRQRERRCGRAARQIAQTCAPVMAEGPARRLRIQQRFEMGDGTSIETSEMAQRIRKCLPGPEGVPIDLASARRRKPVLTRDHIERRDPIERRDVIESRDAPMCLAPIQNRGHRIGRAAEAEGEQDLGVTLCLFWIEEHLDESFGPIRTDPSGVLLRHPLEIASTDQCLGLDDREYLRHNHARCRQQEEHDSQKNRNRAGPGPLSTTQITTSRAPAWAGCRLAAELPQSSNFKC